MKLYNLIPRKNIEKSSTDPGGDRRCGRVSENLREDDQNRWEGWGKKCQKKCASEEKK